MADTVDVSHGITVVFATSGFTGSITDINGVPVSREVVDTTHQGTTVAHTKLPVDLYDAGNLEFTVHYLPDKVIPINGAMETVTLTWPSGTTHVFSACMISFVPDAPHLQLMTAQVTLAVTSSITVDPGGAGGAGTAFVIGV